MTQEDRQLLLADLCARLPYNVICEILLIKVELKADYIKYLQKDTTFQIRPYLRLMSSMTEKEKEEYHRLCDSYYGIYFDTAESIDWLNKKMFDYRGLIPKGLAIEAPEGMYKY